MPKRLVVLFAVLVTALLVVPAAFALRVHVRVEGKTQTIYGSAEPTLSVTSNALDALDSASAAGEFYYHVTVTSFGPYVDQIGRYVAGATTGWVFKVNGVSPPVGADEVTLKDGDRVLWYWATFGPAGGPPTLTLRAGPKRNCYRVLAQDDTGQDHARAGGTAARGRPQCPRPHRLGLRRRPSRARDGHAQRRGPLERDPVRRAALAAALLVALAGCGSSSLDEHGRRRDALGDARPRRPRPPLDERPCRRVGAAGARPRGEGEDPLRRPLRARRRRGRGAGNRSWFYYVNGYLADRSAADYRLRKGDLAWWDYRSWRNPAQDPVVVGAFPQPFLSGYDGRRRSAVVVSLDPDAVARSRAARFTPGRRPGRALSRM